MNGDRAIMSGRLPAKLGNDISDAIYAAVKKGMGMDETLSVVVAVVADYGLREYGSKYLKELGEAMCARPETPNAS